MKKKDLDPRCKDCSGSPWHETHRTGEIVMTIAACRMHMDELIKIFNTALKAEGKEAIK